MSRRLKQTNQVYQCAFDAQILEASVNVRFACTFFTEWKNNANKTIAKTQNNNVTIKNGKAQFNEHLICKTYLIYDTETKEFLKKETFLCVVLISQRKPGQEKLVGRTKVDLADIIHNDCFSEPQQIKLQFSSIKQATITFSVKLVSKQKSDLQYNQLDMDSFSNIDYSSLDIQAETPQQKIISKLPQPPKIDNSAQQFQSPIRKSHNQQYESPQPSKPSKNQQALKHNLQELESQKNAIIQELLSQIQEQTKSKIQAEQKYKQMVAKYEKLSQQYEESQRLKCQYDAENMEIKYQLSELKTILENINAGVEVGSQKNIQAEEKVQQHRCRQNQLLGEIDNLKEKIDFLTNQLQCSQKNSNRNEEISNQCVQLLEIKQGLEQALKQVNKEKQRIQEQKRELQQKILKPGQSELVNDELQKKLASIQGQVDRLKQQISKHQQSRGQLETKVKNQQNQISSLNEQLFKIQCKSQQQQQEHDKLENINQNLIIQLKQHENKTIQYENQLKKAKGQRQREENQVSQKDLQLKALQKYLGEKQQQISEMKQQNQQLFSENKKISQSMHKLQYQNKRLESQLRSFNEMKDEKTTEVANLQQQIYQLNKVRSQLVNKVMRLENDAKNSTTSLAKAQKQAKSKDAVITEKNFMIDHLNQQIQQQIKKAQDFEERLNKFTEKQAQMRQNIFVLEEQSKKIYDIVVEQQSVLESQDQQLNDKDEELSILKSTNSEYLQKNLKQNEEINTMKKLIYDLRKSSLNRGDQGSNQIKNEQISQIQEDRIAELERTIQEKDTELIQNIGHLNKNIEFLEENRRSLEQKLNQLQEQRSDSKKQKDELMQKIRRLQFTLQENNIQLKMAQQQKQANKGSQKQELELKQSEFAKLSKNNIMLQGQIIDYENLCNEQKNKVDEYQTRVNELLFKLAQAQNTHNSQSKASPKNSNQTNSLAKQIELLRNQIEYLEERNKQLQSQANRLQKQKKSINTTAQSGHTNQRQINQINSTKSKQQIMNGLKGVSNELRQLLNERSQQNQAEGAIQILVNSNKMMEDSMNRIIEERGLIQQNARKLSLEFQKFKANVLKSKAYIQDKRQMLDNIKPCELKVKDLVRMSENLSEFITGEDEVE